MLTEGIDVRPSATDNVGLFAVRPVRAGTVVWLPCDKCSRWTKDEVAELPEGRFASLDKYGHLLTDGSLLLPCLGAYLMNHSCEANVLDFGLDFGVAVTDIAAGAEVTCDYATFTEDAGWEMSCRCRVGSCRGRITTGQGSQAAVQERWRARIDAVLPLVASVPQPLHDVLTALSGPYRRILAGARTLATVSTGASVCAPGFLSGRSLD